MYSKEYSKMEDQYIQISPNVRVNQTIINRRNEKAAEKTKRYYEEKESKKIFSKKNKLYSFTDGDFIFLFFIKDYQIKGGESPLPFVFRNIREILRNKNKQKFLNEIEDKFYNEALASKHIKIYK